MKSLVKNSLFDSVDEASQLPLSLGPLVCLVKLFYCLCYLEYFNDRVVFFWDEKEKSPTRGEKKNQFCGELDFKIVANHC